MSSLDDASLDTPIITHRDRIVLNMAPGTQKEISSLIFPERVRKTEIRGIHALNEIVIEWGANSFLTNVEMFVDGNFLTAV